MFGRELDIENNVASSVRQNDKYKIVLSIERLDGKPITEEEAQIVLTQNIATMFTQRTSFGVR